MRKNLLTSLLLMMILIFSQLSFANNDLNVAKDDCETKDRPENIDVAFVLDRSVSMVDPINDAANAISQAIQLMQVNDEVGLACYSDEAETVFDMTTIVDENTMADAINSMNAITIFGMTSIALGLQEGQQVLNAAETTNSPQGMVLLSDGKQNHVPFVGEVLPSIPSSTDVYTIGFGEDCDEYVLNVIANSTNGLYRYCDGGNIAEVTEEIMQEMRDRGIVARFGENIVNNGDIYNYDFIVDEAGSDLTINLLWNNSDTALNLRVTDPHGNILEPVLNEVVLNEFETQQYYTIANPTSGMWHAKVTTEELAADPERFFLHVSIDSQLKLEINFDADNYYAENPVGIVANLYNNLEVIENAIVTATVITPEFEEFELTLYDDSNHNDAEANDGIFAAAFDDALEGTYTVTVYATDINGNFTRSSARSTYVRPAELTDSEETDVTFAEMVNLHNYPNPFNPTTTINFNLQEAVHVRIEIYNIQGQVINSVANGNYGAGSNNVEWDGLDGEGRPVASGLYFYKMKAGRYTSTKKMILMK